MSRKILCDRCGAELTKSTVWVVNIESELHDWDSQSRYDLCLECYEELKNWIADARANDGKESGCADA